MQHHFARRAAPRVAGLASCVVLLAITFAPARADVSPPVQVTKATAAGLADRLTVSVAPNRMRPGLLTYTLSGPLAADGYAAVSMLVGEPGKPEISVDLRVEEAAAAAPGAAPAGQPARRWSASADVDRTTAARCQLHVMVAVRSPTVATSYVIVAKEFLPD